MRTSKPTDRLLIALLRHVGALLGTGVAYVHDGRFYFPLDSRWAIAISPDSAGRLRVDVCTGARIRATMWTQAWDRDRLADLVLSAKAEALALTA
jgi:hypothetical protein